MAGQRVRRRAPHWSLEPLDYSSHPVCHPVARAAVPCTRVTLNRKLVCRQESDNLFGSESAFSTISNRPEPTSLGTEPACPHNTRDNSSDQGTRPFSSFSRVYEYASPRRASTGWHCGAALRVVRRRAAAPKLLVQYADTAKG